MILKSNNSDYDSNFLLSVFDFFSMTQRRRKKHERDDREEEKRNINKESFLLFFLLFFVIIYVNFIPIVNGGDVNRWIRNDWVKTKNKTKNIEEKEEKEMKKMEKTVLAPCFRVFSFMWKHLYQRQAL